MRQWCRHISSRRVRSVGRWLVTCAVVPALLVNSLTTRAILIHNHHGHEMHGPTMTLCDLDDLRENSEHQHDKHDHDGLPVDPAENEGTPILIVLDLPEALPGARTFSAGAAVTAGIGAARRTLAINSYVVEDGRAPVESQQTLASIPRARSLVTGILLTNHALLL